MVVLYGATFDFPSQRVRRFDETSLSNQLNAILTTAQDAVSERGEHNRVAVIVVDDVTRPEISATNIGALRYDLDVILVDLSRSGVGSQVQNALYDPNNYIRFFPGSSNYQQFLRNFGGKVCEAMKRFHSNGGPTPAK
ncbi:hypothetical protein Btru_007857 [Bulinus truncatus]|nr:hypothetical protein Btru_007857 [Bulinus truncatus]